MQLTAVFLLLGLAAALLSGIAGIPAPGDPGSPLRQTLSIVGTLLLLMPFAFAVIKRSGQAARTPAWFSAHVLCAALGGVLVTAHAAAGNLLTAPGLVFACLLFLLVQGLAARTLLSHRIAALFAARPASFNTADPELRERLRKLIARKRTLLERLDPEADEAVFSPDLRHLVRHPWLGLRYRMLAFREARLVGRDSPGFILAFWRRIHIAVAFLFAAGVLVHVVLVLFFAGYVAGDEPIDWWHITAWGG